MTFPGPDRLGRGVVVSPGAPAPAPLDGLERVEVRSGILADEERLRETVELLHRKWVSRRRVAVELGIDQEELRAPVVEGRPPWVLGQDFTFLAERLHFLVWANNWDCRSGRPVWWWGRKAARLGAREGGGADVVLPDGTHAWVDGGPRTPLDIPAVHYESVELGRLALVPGPGPSEGAAAGLAPDQQAAVRHRSGPARIIAPAGSGKTRTLTARLVHLVDRLGVEPSLAAAVAYNNRAAAEMRNRLGRGNLRIRTLHSLGWRIVREVRPDAVLLHERQVRERLGGLVWKQPRLNTDVIGPYVEAMADIRIGFRDPDDVEQERDDVPDLARIFTSYRAVLARRDEVDHDEQIYGAVELLLADPVLRRRWQGRCRHMLVDEFQDMTPAYLLLVRLLSSPSLTVFGVGDDDQTIYGYAGADPGFLLDFDRLFPGAACHSLEVNYRSPAEVVEAASSLLVHNRRRVPKTIRAAAGAEGAGPGGLRIFEAPDDRVTSGAVEVVAGWLDEGVSADAIAVLARVNSALLPMLAGLTASGIPVRSRMSSGLLNRTVMRAALAWIRLAADPDRMRLEDLLEAARRPSRGINRLSSEMLSRRRFPTISADELVWLGRKLEDRQLKAWSGWMAGIELAAKAAEAGRSRPLLEVLLDEVGLGGAAGRLDRGRTRVDRASHSDDLVALRRTADIYRELSTFEERLRTLLEQAADPDEAAEGVTLSTVHRVKGMEWDRVVVFGVDDGLMPHSLSTDLEEERRVLHVAMTRGRRRVLLTADAAVPSPFLAELKGEPPRARAPSASAAAAPRAGGKPGPRRPVDEEREVDQELLEKLKAWRRAESAERKVPAFVVFHDRTLEAIAAALPRTESQLLDVSGIGPKKLDDYGEDLLELVREHSGS